MWKCVLGVFCHVYANEMYVAFRVLRGCFKVVCPCHGIHVLSELRREVLA